MLDRQLFVRLKTAKRLRRINAEIFNDFYREHFFAYYNKDGSLTTEKTKTPVPLYQQAVSWMDKLGYNIMVIPDYYNDGIIWEYQIYWYSDINKVPEENYNISSGTYRINSNDCLMRNNAIDAAINRCLDEYEKYGKRKVVYNTKLKFKLI